MPRIRSEIADDFFKTLERDGVVKTAYPVLDSEETERIADLYNTRYEGQPEDYDITGIAHPNAVIIAPSYDKINGLFENNLERNNIMTNLALNMPTGSLLANTKYASKELTMELVRIANQMDSSDNEEIFKLADACLLQLDAVDKKKLKKEAIAPLAIAGIIAATLGGAWLYAHLDDADNGLLANCDNAITQLKDLQETSWYEAEIDEQVKSTADSLIKNITILKNEAQTFLNVTSDIDKPRDLDDLKKNLAKFEAQASEHGDSVSAALDRFRKIFSKVAPMISQAIENFSSAAYQKNHQKNTWFGDIAGRAGDLLHGRWGLVANDFISAVNALNPLKASLQEVARGTFSVDQVIAKYKKKIEEAESASKPQENTPAPASPTAPTNQPKTKSISDSAREVYESMTKDLGQ